MRPSPSSSCSDADDPYRDTCRQRRARQNQFTTTSRPSAPLAHLDRMPLAVVDVHLIQPHVLLFGAQTVQIEAEAHAPLLDLQYGVLAIVLVADAEQFALLFARPEAQLQMRRELVRLERQRVLHVALRVERDRRRRHRTRRARVAGRAFAPRLVQVAHAHAVLATPVHFLRVAQLLGLRAAHFAVQRRQARMR